MPRPRKPTALKVLEGNRGKRRLPDEPKPTLGIPTCPAFLGSQGRAEWQRIAGQLHRIGMLAKVDRPLLAVHCETWEIYAAAAAKLKKDGVIIDGKNGPARHPATIVLNAAAEKLMQTAAHFGLSPATRARLGRFIGVPQEPDQPEDELGDFLNHGKKAR